MKIRRMLVANRGEIAVRIIRACHELGIEAVLAHSEADRTSSGARLADFRMCIGPGPAEKSYLNIPNVVSAALMTGCDALHPGYGFLAENAYLAEICAHCDLLFIGPPPAAMEQFRNKLVARQKMVAAGLPVVPGSDDILPNLEAALSAADSVGFPVMLKAVAGGGGRGMRIASSEEEMVRVFPLARAEAQATFGNGDLYLERLIFRPKHIEVQVAADDYGHAIHLGERDCSLQRRHQKIIEEAPSPALDPESRRSICEAAVQGALFAGYRNLGTMEFLRDQDGAFYFIEMNTRLQVEHTVTEMITGIDLVKLQIRLAQGEPLPVRQEAVGWRGHAIECRITAEDPERDFAPEYTPIGEYDPPGGPGVRVDSHIYAGYEPPPYYDPLLAKIISWGEDRAEALARMERALRETRIVGPKTTIPHQIAVVRHEEFQRGSIHTQWALPPSGPEIARGG